MTGDWANKRRVGQKNGAAKLTEEDVRALRKVLAAGIFTRTSIAREFGVSRMATWLIETGRNWGEVA